MNFERCFLQSSYFLSGWQLFFQKTFLQEYIEIFRNYLPKGPNFSSYLSSSKFDGSILHTSSAVRFSKSPPSLKYLNFFPLSLIHPMGTTLTWSPLNLMTMYNCENNIIQLLSIDNYSC